MSAHVEDLGNGGRVRRPDGLTDAEWAELCSRLMSDAVLREVRFELELLEPVKQQIVRDYIWALRHGTASTPPEIDEGAAV